MKIRVVYSNNVERDSAIAANSGLRIVAEENHIIGQIVFSSEPIKLSLEERIIKLENEIATLKGA